MQDFPCSCCRHSGNRDPYMHGLAGRSSRRQCHRLPCLCCCFVVLFCLYRFGSALMVEMTVMVMVEMGCVGNDQ
jgi:hypothetical protein